MTFSTNSLKNFAMVKPLIPLPISIALKMLRIELKKISMSYYYPLNLLIFSIIRIWRKNLKNQYPKSNLNLENYLTNEIY